MGNSKKSPCNRCNDFGRYQTYRHARVISEYCDCPAGLAWVERIRKMLENMGKDPYSSEYAINQKPKK
ncbi:MAG: hypothetical protein CME70_19305 [Halobacteriovorax sp.]|nr:hypothetical protein [Halobacteriovorax sp.]